jgi:uncharacterized repeat protein (TIGR01451 family)
MTIPIKRVNLHRIHLHWLWALLLLVFLIVCLSTTHTAGAQTISDFDITLEELGYGERQLVGPVSSVRYYFALPANWEPQNGSYVELDLDYAISSQDDYSSALLEVRLNDQLLHTESLESSGDRRLQVDIPPGTLFLVEDQSLNNLQLDFRVNEECEQALLVSLTVRNSSLLHLTYQERPWQPDLALYPKPIYQEQAFELGQVRFVLPSEPNSTDLRAATMIAARLGQLTLARLPISVTLSSDLLPDTLSGEHLIIIGRPDDNPWIRQLTLPVSLAERHLALSSQMPAVVEPGDTISYTLVVDNKSDATQSLVVEDRLPAEGQLLACSGQCEEITPGVIRWELGSLAPGGQISTTVGIRLDALTPPGAVIEHTASLLDGQGIMLNVDTLSAQAGIATSEQLIATGDKPSSYFFVHNDQGVAEGDGLVQEIVSPWSSGHAAIVVTGLDETALLKAAQALSADADFPGMWGDYVIVQATRSISGSVPVSFEDISFASQGYSNRSLSVFHREYFDHYFDVPPGWNLSDNAYLALHIAHGIALDDVQATLEVELNDVPIGSARLDEASAYTRWITFPLPTAASRPGSNWMRLQISADAESECRFITSDRYWLTVYADSFLHLPRQTTGLMLNLDNFPYSFRNHPGLEDVVFLLPEHPSLAEIEGVLRLALQLGRIAGGDAFWPQVVLGRQPDAEPWAGYQLIVIGLPTCNHYITAVNSDLPQPFRPGTNEILQVVDRVVYRLPPDVSLGYVQALPSPWDEGRVMLVVTGTTAEGVVWALTSLTDDQLSWQLSGNLAVVRDREVRSMDTREIAPEDVAAITQGIEPNLVPVATPTLTSTTTLSPSLAMTPSAIAPTTSETAPSVTGRSQPVWLVPVLILSALLVVISVGLAVWQARSQ